MLAEGRIERETDHSEVPITYLICRKLIDRSDLLGPLTLEEGPVNTDKPTPLRPGEAAATAGLPASRDFR
jgi:error-prone DNA polymerase